MQTPDTLNEYNGLDVPTPSLDAQAYHDPRRHAQELARIWNRHWIYVGRSAEIAAARAYCTFQLGEQSLLIVRGEDGVVRGFHNTCRHRGAALCTESRGVLRSASIVCPYHAWVYDLQGHLRRTSSKRHGEGFDATDFPLYPIAVHEWRGFLFVALSEDSPPFELSFDLPPARFDAWPLEDLVVAHVLDKTIRCNWKIFWENYNECLHCPAVHPQLSQLVPIFGRGLLEERDDPDWRRHAADPDPKFKGGLRAGAHTWSLDGQLAGRPFPALSAQDRQLGAVYLTQLPSLFLVGHADYVRVVRLLPLGPELTGMRVEYLFSRESLGEPGFDLRKVVDFTNTVMTEDAEICELNQRGLKAAPHTAGVVMPEEYYIRQFHLWVQQALGG